MAPYVNGNHTSHLFEMRARVMKLDSNESTVDPSPRVVSALAEFIHQSPLNWYPDIESVKLREALSEYTSAPIDCIQTFNGSDNALETICRTYLQKGDEVVLCMPAYDHFRLYAESCDATLVPVFGETPFASKPKELVNAVTPRTKMIYIVNPNNPTGLLYSEDEIRFVLEACPEVLVLVDEAYFEFCKVTVVPLTKEYPNLIVTRSFSKAFGLAGIRCGYVVTNPNNLQVINKVRVGKNINSLAQVAARAALEDMEHISRFVTEVKVAKGWLKDKLSGLGLEVVETPANFVLVRVAEPQQVKKFLEEKLVYVRDRSSIPQMEGFLRITIGHQHLMERFWKVFQTTPANYLYAEGMPRSVLVS